MGSSGVPWLLSLLQVSFATPTSKENCYVPTFLVSSHRRWVKSSWIDCFYFSTTEEFCTQAEKLHPVNPEECKRFIWVFDCGGTLRAFLPWWDRTTALCFLLSARNSTEIKFHTMTRWMRDHKSWYRGNTSVSSLSKISFSWSSDGSTPRLARSSDDTASRWLCILPYHPFSHFLGVCRVNILAGAPTWSRLEFCVPSPAYKMHEVQHDYHTTPQSIQILIHRTYQPLFHNDASVTSLPLSVSQLQHHPDE